LFLDDETKNRKFGHYIIVLVDLDLPKQIYDDIMIEHDGYAFYVEVLYEKNVIFLPKLLHDWFPFEPMQEA